MTFADFNRLPFGRQLALVLDTGTFLAWRWEDGNGLHLYHLPGGFFAELRYDPHVNRLVRIHSFAHAAPLAAYAAQVQLPGDWA